MPQLRPMSGPSPDPLALEASADRARRAFVCDFACSDEYEAEVIRVRRAAGIYGPSRQQRQAFAAFAFAAAVLLLALLGASL
jgi:hypothetical protein